METFRLLTSTAVIYQAGVRALSEEQDADGHYTAELVLDRFSLSLSIYIYIYIYIHIFLVFSIVII